MTIRPLSVRGPGVFNVMRMPRSMAGPEGEAPAGTGAAEPLRDRVPVARCGLLNPSAGAQGKAGTPRQKLPAEPQSWATLKTCACFVFFPKPSVHMIKPTETPSTPIALPACVSHGNRKTAEVTVEKCSFENNTDTRVLNCFTVPAG